MEEATQIPIRQSALRKTTVSILLVLAVGSAAYLMTREPTPVGRESLIELAGREMDGGPTILSPDAASLEEYIKESFSANINLPTIDRAEFSGAGAFELAQGVSIPTVFIEDPEGDVDRIFVMTYSLLDDWSASVFLDRSIRLELEHDGSYAVVSNADDTEIVAWRSGDDIFLAVARHGASRLISRIES